MLKIFKQAGEQNSRYTYYQFWKQNNQPKELYSDHFTQQKIEYIYNNPVEAGIVDKAEKICTAAQEIIIMAGIVDYYR